MKDQATTWAKKVWGDFKSFAPGQKAVTIAAVVALIVGGILFASWKSKPSYAPLYTNLSTTDAAAVVEQLQDDGVEYKLGANGTQILVPKDKVYDTRLEMSSAGLPTSSAGGYALLDDEGITTSEFKQQVDYQRAIEGELQKTIEALDGVQTASVHLAIPKQDVFNDGTKDPTAAVMLTLKPGASVTNSQVQSIVYLVSSSVPELTTDNVTVADSSGHVLAAPGEKFGGVGGLDGRAQMTQEYNTRLASAIQAMLDKAVGPGNSVVTVNSELDFDKTSTTTQDYNYEPDTPPVWSEKSTEDYQGTDAPGDTLGTGEPDVDTETTGDGDGTYNKTHETVTNALGTITKTVDGTPGAVKKLSVAVLLDDPTDDAAAVAAGTDGAANTQNAQQAADTSAAEPVDVEAIRTLVASAVGLDAERGDSLAIQTMAFDTSAQEAAKAQDAAAAEAAAAKAHQEKVESWIKQGAIAAVILIIVLITWIASRRRKKAAMVPDDDDDMDLITHQMPDDALLTAPQPEAEPVELPKVDEGAGRRALVALAHEQPDDVARVLSGWLSSAGPRQKEGASR